MTPEQEIAARALDLAVRVQSAQAGTTSKLALQTSKILDRAEEFEHWIKVAPMQQHGRPKRVQR